MPDPPPDDTVSHNEVIAQLRREFCDGLPARVQRMQAALDGLTQGYATELAERFYVEAHSLKGTAASYGADGVSRHAANLADTARGWLDGGVAAAPEVSAAAAEIASLSAAVERYAADVANENRP